MIAVIGSETFDDLESVKRFIFTLPLDAVLLIPNADRSLGWGNMKGVGRVACQSADSRALKVIGAPLELEHGRHAESIQAAKIARACSRLVAFDDGQDELVKNTILRARNFGKPVEVFKPGRSKN